MQATGAEMLRLACCLATERGIRVCAPVHDALLVEADLADEECVLAAVRGAMGEASRLVLGGLEIGTDVKVIRWPERYSDPRGQRMWNLVNALLNAVVQ